MKLPKRDAPDWQKEKLKIGKELVRSMRNQEVELQIIIDQLTLIIDTLKHRKDVD